MESKGPRVFFVARGCIDFHRGPGNQSLAQARKQRAKEPAIKNCGGLFVGIVWGNPTARIEIVWRFTWKVGDIGRFHGDLVKQNVMFWKK